MHPRLPVHHVLLGRRYSDGEWEALCTPNCGLCCQEHVERDGRWVPTGIPCPQLDLLTLRCRQYERRHEVEPHCQKVTPAFVLLGRLPADCGYMDALAAATDAVAEDPPGASRSRGRR